MRRAEWVTAAIGLGSNLGDPSAQLRRAMSDLAGIPHCEVVMRSSLYRSLAVGPDGLPVAQPDFCNAAVLLETSLGPRELLQALHEIEAAHGRVRHERWTARTLDLDLLVYGTEVLREEGLTVPHPRIAGRNFVLVPLRDIAPALEIPGLGRVNELASGVAMEGLKPWQD